MRFYSENRAGEPVAFLCVIVSIVIMFLVGGSLNPYQEINQRWASANEHYQQRRLEVVKISRNGKELEVWSRPVSERPSEDGRYSATSLPNSVVSVNDLATPETIPSNHPDYKVAAGLKPGQTVIMPEEGGIRRVKLAD